MIGWAWRAGRSLVRWFRDLADDRPRISRTRAHALWYRQEMDRHPIERVDPEPAEGTPQGLGEPLKPGDVRKAPVFGNGNGSQ